jgi:membrane AbrB-like protein
MPLEELPVMALYAVAMAAAIGLGVLLKFPQPLLVGPALGAAIVNLARGAVGPEAPGLFITAAQISMGAYMGQRIYANGGIRNWEKVFICSLCGNAALVLFALLLGKILTQAMSAELVDAFLSTAPGGMDVMGLTAAQINADVPMVISFQLFRLFFILFTIPPLMKLWMIRKRKSGRSV